MFSRISPNYPTFSDQVLRDDHESKSFDAFVRLGNEQCPALGDVFDRARNSDAVGLDNPTLQDATPRRSRF